MTATGTAPAAPNPTSIDPAVRSGRARLAGGLFVVLAAVGGLVLGLLYHEQRAAYWSLARADEERKVALGSEVLTLGLGTVAADLLYLAGQGALQRWLATGDPAVRAELAADYQALAAGKPAYQQVRFMDEAGREAVRVERTDGTVRIAGEDAPARGADDDPDVAATLRLDRGRVYMSPFGLETHGGVVVQPLTPMIRFATPVAVSDGRKQGLVMVDYLGRTLLDRLRDLVADGPGEIALLNAAGYWLLAPDPGDEWGFMIPERRERTFGRAFPQAWRRIDAGASGGQFVSGGDLFTYVRITPGGAGRPDGSQRAIVPSEAAGWILLARLPAAAVAQETAVLNRNFAIAAGALTALLAAASWFVAGHWAARHRTEAGIRRSEARFRSLLESAPDAVLITDSRGRILLANAQSEAMFGYPRAELVGRGIEMLIPERYRERHVNHRERYVAAPRARPMGAGLELYARRADGTEFPVAVALSPARDRDEQLTFCDVRDITEQKEAERRIHELAARLERDNAALTAVNKELEAFSYSVSHDLRAPLRAIDGFSQALVEDYGPQLDEPARHYLDRIRGAAQRMAALIDDLLGLARVTRAEMSLAEVDLSAAAAQFVDELRSSDPRRRAEVRIAPDMRVRGDPRLLNVALANLLRNAWKFTGKRECSRIEFGRVERDGAAVYYVKDNGAGFDMAYAAKLFGAFQRLHDANEFAGTGIGLATVQRIIHKHGGRVWAEAEPDNGATFFFTLADKGAGHAGEGDPSGRGQS